MSYYTMSNKELSQLIRKALKESGFTSKDLSVRVRAALYDTSVNITIKNPLVRISEVEEIVKRFSEVDYDEHSGEILAGCNVYVHCQYEYGIFKDAAADLLPVAEMVLSNKEKYSGHAIADNKEKSVHIIHYQGVQWIWLLQCGGSKILVLFTHNRAGKRTGEHFPGGPLIPVKKLVY